MAPFSVIVFGVVLDNSRIRSKTAPFSFENGLVWTEPFQKLFIAIHLFICLTRVSRSMKTCIGFFNELPGVFRFFFVAFT